MGYHDYILKKIPYFMGRHDTKRIARHPVKVDGFKEASDIPYIDSGHKYHTLDVYYPIGTDKPLPTIIDVHGGGWVYGEKEINKPYCLMLAKKGYTVVNINYRLMPEVSFPENLQDIFAALNWVEAHGKDYFCDLDNVYITGDSAGGHLVNMVLTAMADPQFAELCGVQSGLNFRAACLNCAVFDLEGFTKRHKIPFLGYLHKVFLGDDYLNSAYLKYLTVRNNEIEKFPPMFIITNEGDFMRRQGMEFVKECQKRGIPHEFDYTKKADSKNKLEHVCCMTYPDYEESIATNDAMLAFFKKYAK